jgi:hypothetical protein
VSIDIKIVSGEGSGEGTVEEYDGKITARAVLSRLRRERCRGDRWAFARLDDERMDDADMARRLQQKTP